MRLAARALVGVCFSLPAACSLIVDVGDLSRDDAAGADADADVPLPDDGDGAVDGEPDGDVGPEGDDGVAEGDIGDGDAESDVDPCTMPPPAPAPLAPENGARTGSVHAPGSFNVLRPELRWRFEDDGCGPVTFDVSVDDSCTTPGFATCGFPSPEAEGTGLTELRWRPPGALSVSMTPPVGQRYYWRARACRDATCSDWSSVRYLDVGRVPGDFDGDGYSDVAVGVQGGGGRVEVFLGGRSTAGLADFTFLPEASATAFGTAAAWIGDTNADGFCDLAIGAYYAHDAADARTGRVYVYLGDASPDDLADVVLTGAAAEDLFGAALDGAGDANGDGFADVVVGSSGSGARTGRADIFLGGSPADAVSDVTFTGEAVGDWFGRWVSAAGDMNGDGFGDTVVSALGGSGAGYAEIFLGGVTLDALPDAVFSGEEAGDSVRSGAGTGDIDGDGFADVVVGAPGHGDNNNGRAYILLGGPFPDGIADLIADGDSCPSGSSTSFGDAACGAGDVDGDGLSDFIVGTGGCNGGVDLYLGNSAPDFVSDASFASGIYGEVIAGAGDVNGDGFNDVLLGDRNDDTGGSNTGAAHLFYGSPVAMAADLTFAGVTADDNFGFSVARAR